MAEDAKVAEKQRLAEALRANLRRRKTASAKAALAKAALAKAAHRGPEASAPGSTRDIADNQG